MNDTKGPIQEIVLVEGGTRVLDDYMQPGDLEVTVLLKGKSVDTYSGVRALVRGRQMAVFRDILVDAKSLDALPILGYVDGTELVNRSLPYGTRPLPPIEFRPIGMADITLAKASRVRPPKLPTGYPVKNGEPLRMPKLDGPLWRYPPTFDDLKRKATKHSGDERDWEEANGRTHLFSDRPDPIERFLAEIKPLIEKMAAITEIPRQVEIVNTVPIKVAPTAREVEIKLGPLARAAQGQPGSGEFTKKAEQMAAERDRLLHGGTSNVRIESPETVKRIYTDFGSATGRERIHLDMPLTEFRELVTGQIFDAVTAFPHAREPMPISISKEAYARIVRLMRGGVDEK